jgi:outer membrane protein assembly factor BamE
MLPRFCLAAVGAALVGGCANMPVPRIPGLTPYKIDIQQGNFVTQEMVSQLKPGMTRDQVRNALGTPLLTDIFHADRWDYIYSKVAADGTTEKRKLAVFFDGDKLARVEGDVVAAAPKEDAAKEESATRGETK